MKRNNFISILAVLTLSALTLTSCLKDEKEVFDESPSTRLQQTLEKTKTILESQANGWVMYVYPKDPSTESMLMGYIYTVKFQDSKVTARSQRDNAGQKEETSYYKLTNDEGPVLSFDTGNSILHYWSTPGASSSQYQGRGGDYEFNILEATNDHVTLIGKRYRCIAELVPLQKEASEYIADCLAATVAQDSYFGITCGDVKGLAEFYVTSTYQVLWIGYNETSVGEDGAEAVEEKEIMVPFVYLPDRIRLYEPIELGGQKFQELVVDPVNMTVNVLDGQGVSFGHPHSYLSADQIEGNYTLTYNKKSADDNEDVRTIDVSLEKIVDGEGNVTGFKMNGLNENWAPVLSYDDWWGELDLRIQNLGRVTTNQNGYVRLCFADLSYFNWTLTSNTWPYSSTTNFRYNVSGTYYNNCYYTCTWDEKDAAKPTIGINYCGYTYSSRLYNSWYLNCYSTATGTTNRYALDLTSGWGFNIPGTGKPAAAGEEGAETESSVVLPYPYSITKK